MTATLHHNASQQLPQIVTWPLFIPNTSTNKLWGNTTGALALTLNALEVIWAATFSEALSKVALVKTCPIPFPARELLILTRLRAPNSRKAETCRLLMCCAATSTGGRELRHSPLPCSATRGKKLHVKHVSASLHVGRKLKIKVWYKMVARRSSFWHSPLDLWSPHATVCTEVGDYGCLIRDPIVLMSPSKSTSVPNVVQRACQETMGTDYG